MQFRSTVLVLASVWLVGASALNMYAGPLRPLVPCSYFLSMRVVVLLTLTGSA